MASGKKIRVWLAKPILPPGQLTWNLAMVAFFIRAVVSSIQLVIPLSLDPLISLSIGLAFIPGLYFVFLDFVRIDSEAPRMIVKVGKVMAASIVIFLAGFVSTSVNNMAIALHAESPIYPFLGAVRVADVAATLVLGICAVLVRKRMPYIVLKEGGPPSRNESSVTGILAATGVLLMLLGLTLGYVSIVPLEGLILLLVGLILFSIGLDGFADDKDL